MLETVFWWCTNKHMNVNSTAKSTLILPHSCRPRDYKIKCNWKVDVNVIKEKLNLPAWGGSNFPSLSLSLLHLPFKIFLLSFFFMPTTNEMPNSSSLVWLFLWKDPTVKTEQCIWDTGMLCSSFSLVFILHLLYFKWPCPPSCSLSIQIQPSLKIRR